MCTAFWTTRALVNEKYDGGYLYTIYDSSKIYLSFFPIFFAIILDDLYVNLQLFTVDQI